MILATQEQVDKFMAEAMFNKEIFPYLTMSTFNSSTKVSEDDWSKLVLTNSEVDFILSVNIDRSMENAFTISLWSKIPYWSGKALQAINELVTRYNPISIETSVHISNTRSRRINRKLLGEPWGVEPKGAWNGLTGQWEDCLHFKKILR